MTKRFKRSKRIRLILLSGISAGALTGCLPEGKSPLSTDNGYANNYFVPGAGYYHAPFCAWFPLPYNPLGDAVDGTLVPRLRRAHASRMVAGDLRGGFGGRRSRGGRGCSWIAGLAVSPQPGQSGLSIRNVT